MGGGELTQKVVLDRDMSAHRSQKTRTSPMRQATPSVPEGCRRTSMYMYTLTGELLGSR